ncbi:MAG: SusD/RagB family nutrient-binding outer membrane lipoprotein [Muribaculaceae bacterium]
MIKKYIKSSILFGAALLMGVGCTGDFEEINTNPYQIADKDVKMSDLFNEAQLSVFYNQSNGNWEYQLIQNLNADLYSGYMAIPTAFNGGNNNDNYFMMNGWNSYTLDYMLLHVVKPMVSVQKIDDLADDFFAISEILKVAGAHKMVDTYGPCPYTEAMQGGISVNYDSEETCYTTFLTELADASERLTRWLDANNGDDPDRLGWDKMCGQSQTRWLQFGNTLRLRLAIRLSVIAPDVAKQHAKAACENKYGLLTSADVEVKDANTRNPQALICRDYNDCCISANYETILKGYNDPRLEETCQAVGWGNKGDILDQNGNGTGNLGKIKGIRNGLQVDGSSYKMFSIIKCPASGGPYSTDVPLPIMSRAESYFLQAEAALRGFISGDVKSLYEDGIRASFAKYGLDASEYIKGETTQIDYEDPHNPANNISALNDVPVKFLEGADLEKQLQQIITQKWIAGFPEGLNGWAEYRRTGYPKLFPIPSNNCNVQAEYLAGSSATLVEIGIRRLPFAYGERSSNPAGLATGISILNARGQKDCIDERLWWDTGRNF